MSSTDHDIMMIVDSLIVAIVMVVIGVMVTAVVIVMIVDSSDGDSRSDREDSR